MRYLTLKGDFKVPPVVISVSIKEAAPLLSAHMRILPATATFKLSMSPAIGIETQ